MKTKDKYIIRYKSEDSLLGKHSKRYDENLQIEVKGLTKSYTALDRKVLDGLDLTIKKGETISIIGENGAGKSTLFKILNQFETGDSGQIYLNYKNQSDFYSKVSLLVQNIDYPESYKVSELLNLFTKISNLKNRKNNEKFIEFFEIGDILERKLSSLSFGQKKKVSILLTLIKRPEIIFLDELSTGLDQITYRKIYKEIIKWIKLNNITLVLISHKLDEIINMTNKSYFLKGGKIITEMKSKNLTEKKITSLIGSNNEVVIKKGEENTKEMVNKVLFKAPKISNWVDKNITRNYFSSNSVRTKDTIKVNNLTKMFDSVRVLKDISFEIKKGEKIAIVGRNGSGKTTLLECLSLSSSFYAGTIDYWWGNTRKEIISKIGFQFQESVFPSNLKVIEILLFFCKVSHNSWDKKELYFYIDKFNLTDVIKLRGSDLSAGQAQRVNLLISLLKRPELIILDEISSGLDMNSMKQIIKYLNNYFKNNIITMLLVSHNIDEIYKLADKILLLEDGKIKKVVDLKNQKDKMKKIKDLFKNESI